MRGLRFGKSTTTTKNKLLPPRSVNYLRTDPKNAALKEIKGQRRFSVVSGKLRLRLEVQDGLVYLG